MNKVLSGALTALAMVAGGGCATSYYRVSEDAPPPQPPVAQIAPAPAVIAVSAKPADERAARLATALQGAVESRLAARGMTVASPQAANATVELAVSRRETARLNDWRAYEGSARVRVMTTGPAAKLVSEKTVEAAGARALDEVKAEAGVLAGLTKQVNGWLDATVTAQSIPVEQPVPPPGYSLARIRFSLMGDGASPEDLLDAQIAFREMVATMPGVQDCRQAYPGPDARTAVFDVTYDKAQFPDGLVNTIVAWLRRQRFSYRIER